MPPRVGVSPDIICSRDSMLYYYDLGMTQNDPKGLFFMAVSYYGHIYNQLPVDMPFFSREKAEECLLRSAEKGYDPAIRLLRRLEYTGDFSYYYAE